MNTESFKNIIFDFGGVIINIDFQRSIDAFIRLGAKNFDQIYSKARQSGLFDMLEKGYIDPDDFIKQLQALLQPGIKREQVIDAWNKILIDLPEKRIKMLEIIKANYRTFLLSNTNAIHYAVYNQWLKEDHGHEDFEGLFEGVYLSHKLGIRKPEAEIFDRIMNENHLKLRETLFIDDSSHIINAAVSFGLPSYRIKDGENVCSLFIDAKLKKGLDIINPQA